MLQIAHGKIIPEYSSAYALRCRRYLDKFPERRILSVGGLILKDKVENFTSEYRSLIMTIMAVLKGNRSLEIFLSKGKYLRKKYLKALKSTIPEFDIIIFEGPWQYPLVRDQLHGKLIVYDAHNMESALRKGNYWEKYTLEIEKQLSDRADLIITVSEDDRIKISDIYNISMDKIVSIPEGFELPKETWKGISNEIVFIGSAYGPNIDAGKEVIEMAKSLPNYTFKIIGTVCNSLPRKVPGNVKLLGMIDDIRKETELCSSFLALNPVKVGSGRNLKMNDYIAHGIPVITTEIGSRGFSQEIVDNFFIADIGDFINKIREISSLDAELHQRSKAMVDYAKNNNYEKTKTKSYDAIMKILNR